MSHVQRMRLFIGTIQEPIMQPTLDVRRHPDGSIDFDLYRRRAARRRLLAKRIAFRRCRMLFVGAVRDAVAAIRKPSRGTGVGTCALAG